MVKPKYASFLVRPNEITQHIIITWNWQLPFVVITAVLLDCRKKNTVVLLMMIIIITLVRDNSIVCDKSKYYIHNNNTIIIVIPPPHCYCLSFIFCY